MDEDKLLEKIKNSARDVEVPETLEPERLKGKLKNTGSGRNWSIVYKWGAAAAAVCLIVIGAVAVGVNGIGNKKTDSMAMESKTAESAKQSADAENSLKAESAAAPAGAAGLNGLLAPADSYKQICEKLEDYYEKTDSNEYAAGDVLKEETAMSAGEQTQPVEESLRTDYSATNIQEAGVEEGDVVKTDGSYLYILKGTNSVQILKAEGSQVETLSQVEPTDSGNGTGSGQSETIRDMYVAGDKMVLITQYSEADLESAGEDISAVSERSGTATYTYDISDRSSPKVLGRTKQEGHYAGSRLTGGYVYVYTDCYKNGIWRDQGTAVEESLRKEAYFPAVEDEILEAKDIYIPEELSDSNYMVFASVNLEEPGKVQDKKAIMSMSGEFYVSPGSIYMTQQSDGGSDTTILKMDFADGVLTPRAAGVIKGVLNDNFSMNEYENHLRVVTTSYDDNHESGIGNHLFILDENLNITGSIQDLAQGETIQSVRFMGNTGYFVTYRNMDPLFSADLSDPQNPQLLGELKVTGFSSYLHFYGEEQLLGLGYETDPNTGDALGIKLSMYDIHDPANVAEKHKVVLELDEAPALNNYHAFLADDRENLIGFVGRNWLEDSGITDHSYYLYAYDPTQGFINVLTQKLEEDTDGANTRGIYIGDTFYLVESGTNKIKTYNRSEGYTVTGEFEY